MFAPKAMKEHNRAFFPEGKKTRTTLDVGHQPIAPSVQLLQRGLGNSYLQAMVENHQPLGQVMALTGTPRIQRACACGGTCGGCDHKEDESPLLQTKLMIGPTDDVYEQEADRVADQVMRMPDSSTPTTKEHSQAPVNIQRRIAGDSNSPTRNVSLALSQSGGQSLSVATRQFMEPRFGVDFSHVRLHTDSVAQRQAAQINAKAFTYGHGIWLGRGASEQDRSLLAHELTHTIQQNSHLHRLPDSLVMDPRDPAEEKAARVTRTIGEESPVPTIQNDIHRIARQFDAGVSDAGLRDASLPGGVPISESAPVANTTPLSSVAPSISAPPGPTSIKTVKVWLNAFIPAHVPGKAIPAPGPHTGKTMLNGPIFSECYLTDNRTFDAAIHAPSRMHSEIEIDVTGPSQIFQWHHCDETHEINCTTGAAVCTRNGRTSNMRFRNLRGSAASTILVDLEGASNNPCYTGSPDIDYDGTIAINIGTRTVAFSGAIDDFPAFEMYATANGGAGITMFNTMPLPGQDPWNLPGRAARGQTGRATI